MAIGRVNTGGGAGLNFSLKPYATEAALLADAPSENTVGIVTTTVIGKVATKATQPTIISGAAVAEGDIWIAEGRASPAAMQISKKNGAEVWTYPVLCKQYISGAWASKTAKSYIGGAWIDFETWMHKVNDGWNTFEFPYQSWGSGFAMSNSELTCGVVSGLIVFDVDWTTINTVEYEYLVTNGSDNYDDGCYIMITDSDTLAQSYSNYVVRQLYKSKTTEWEAGSLDVSGVTGIHNFKIFSMGDINQHAAQWRNIQLVR